MLNNTQKRTRYRNGNAKSYGAECAEQDGRYPRHAAARALGISVKAFDAGVIRCGYIPSEWHHVGPRAVRTWFYDTVELGESVEFWLGALAVTKTAATRAHIRAAIRPIWIARMWARLKPVEQPKKHGFSLAIKARVEALGIPFSVLFDRLPQTDGGQEIAHGTTVQQDIRMDRHGNIREGEFYTVKRIKRVAPFTLDLPTIRQVFRENPGLKPKPVVGYRWILDKQWLMRGLENLKAGFGFTFANSGRYSSHRSHRAKYVLECRYNERQVKKIN